MTYRRAAAQPMAKRPRLLLWLSLAGISAFERCGDANNNCYKWSLEGRCTNSSEDSVRAYCPFSCGVCMPHSCSAEKADEDFCNADLESHDEEHGGMHCSFWHHLPTRGRIDVYFLHEEEVLVGSLEPNSVFGVKTYEDHVFRLRDAGSQDLLATVRMFRTRIVLIIDEDFMESLKDCVDLPHETWQGSCDDWAPEGQCVPNPGFMTVYCSRSCYACHLRQEETRCTRRFLQMNQEPALRPGDLEQVFRDMNERSKKYSTAMRVLSQSPWIVTFDDIISEEEMAELLASTKVFNQSRDQGEANAFGMQEGIISSKRTSQTAWCQDTCKELPSYIAVINRIAEIVQVPSENFESMQFLKYHVGERYVEHHDMNNEKDNDFACGPRIYTFFLYLSDVEEGGETHFTQLNLSVKPRKGSGLLWPSVLSENPTVQDERTMHEAKPVLRGMKMAANVWVHLYDFSTPNHWACTGGGR